jgi:hypothetical protein
LMETDDRTISENLSMLDCGQLDRHLALRLIVPSTVFKAPCHVLAGPSIGHGFLGTIGIVMRPIVSASKRSVIPFRVPARRSPVSYCFELAIPRIIMSLS